ncbi:MAG TPA: ATP-binding protein [Polyangiaceae bacterium]|nr:ATP-binding protein [Polyangiaceae bacterium]
MTSTPKALLSLTALRNLLLLSLLIGVAAYTATLFAYSQRLKNTFGPQVRADLEWRVLRGAQELARACDVGLVLGDPAMLKKSFGAYATSADVQAIVAVDAEGKVLTTHGKSPEAIDKLFAGKELGMRVEPGYLVSWADATIEGSKVGRIAVVVSTARLSDANALLARASNVTLLGGTLALVLGVLVVSSFTRAVARRDAQLSEHAANLEQKVAERTQELDERNRGMRVVLDNVGQGLVTVDLAGVMANERSASVDRWFGPPTRSMTLSQYLKQHSPAFAQQFELNMMQLADGFLAPELALDQLPKRMLAGNRTFDVHYTPVGAEEQFDKLLVIFDDVTEQLASERAEREQKEAVAIFQRILVDRSGVEDFLNEANKFLSELHTQRDPIVERRLLHTLKGNAAVFGLGSLADQAHELETQLHERDVKTGDHMALLEPAELEPFDHAWREAMARVQQLLGGARRDQIEIGQGELTSLVDRVRAGLPASEIAHELEAWKQEPVERRLEQLGRQASTLARRLGKAAPALVIESSGVRSDGRSWAGYWSAMVHAVRNAVDHGLEDSAARVAAGKPAAGRIALKAERSAKRLIISVEDDGRGIDWEKVRTKAASCGAPHGTHDELVDALFLDGFSTREQVSDISGRGVGLAALRQAVRELGGSIEVDTNLGRGTAFRFIFDEPKAQRPSIRAVAS